MKQTKTKQETQVDKALDTPERFRLGEMGYLGNSHSNGITAEELKQELNFPTNLKTYRQMSYHSAINSSLKLFNNLCSNAEWYVQPPKNATQEELRQVSFIQECMNDMQDSWSNFITQTLTMNTYGFSIHEKVYRRRYQSNGSKYNDGLIAWKSLNGRSQLTVSKFLFDENGNTVTGVEQDLSRVVHNYGVNSSVIGGKVLIPRSKFCLFKAGQNNGSPYGVSMLRDAYVSWKYLTAIEEMEANGVAKDLGGMPILKLPPQYLSADATPEQKQIKAYFENAIRNLQMNQQSGIILPSVFDEMSKQPLFDLTLLSMDGRKAFDTDKVKKYWKDGIYTAMYADLLILGQGATGSYTLGNLKSSMAATAAKNMLHIIRDELNNSLIRQTYELNGFDLSRMCTLEFDGVSEVDLDGYSKAIQRLKSVAMLPANVDTVNDVLDKVGMPELPEGTTQEELNELLGASTSRSGDGLATPFEGTRTEAGDGNDNDNNLDNTA